MNIDITHPESALKKVDGAAIGQNAPLMTTMERVIAAIWEDVLHQPDIAKNADFFDLGGTSLDLIRVFARINKQFDLALNGSVLDGEATIARVTKCVEAARREAK
jgi:acyl carrier protein